MGESPEVSVLLFLIEWLRNISPNRAIWTVTSGGPEASCVYMGNQHSGQQREFKGSETHNKALACFRDSKEKRVAWTQWEYIWEKIIYPDKRLVSRFCKEVLQLKHKRNNLIKNGRHI